MAKPLNENIRSVYAQKQDGEFDTVMDVAGDALADVVKAVSQGLGKAGSVTIKIDVRKATAGTLAVQATVTAKKPKDIPVEALLWPTPDGNLLTEDPAQTRLDLKPVNLDKKPELKSITA